VATAQAQPTTASNGLASPGPEYIVNPEWSSPVRMSEVNLYRPIEASTPGGAVEDCAATADGHLVDCRTVEAKPKGVHYEDAGRLVAERLYRLKPTLPDGQSVAGKRVRFAVVWQ
jgi:hypothetical protein